MSTVRVWMSGAASHTVSSKWPRACTRPRRSASVSSNLNSVGVSSTSSPSTLTRCAARSMWMGPMARTSPAVCADAPTRRRIAPTRSTSSWGLNGLVR